MKTQIFHHAKNIIFKKSSKRNQNLSRHYNSIIKSQVSTQAKIIIFQKSSYKNRPILARGQNPLSYYTL
jgi:hypothetical protein